MRPVCARARYQCERGSSESRLGRSSVSFSNPVTASSHFFFYSRSSDAEYSCSFVENFLGLNAGWHAASTASATTARMGVRERVFTSVRYPARGR